MALLHSLPSLEARQWSTGKIAIKEAKFFKLITVSRSGIQMG